MLTSFAVDKTSIANSREETFRSEGQGMQNLIFWRIIMKDSKHQKTFYSMTEMIYQSPMIIDSNIYPLH